MNRKLIFPLCVFSLLLIISICKASSVSRSFSKTSVNPLEDINVNLTVLITAPQDTYYAIDDTYPLGWTIINAGGGDISQNSSLPPSYTNHIKWAVISGAVNKTYTYVIRTPASAGIYTFSGVYMFNTTYPNENITSGQSQVTVGTNISVITHYYDGSTTNFSAINVSSNITAMILEKLGAGKIDFRENITFSQSVDLDTNSNISFNRAYINSTAFQMLNKSATIQLYNLAFSTPIIQMDGSACPSSICTFVSYSGGILTFNVTHFTTYSAAEGASCGDKTCNGGETCSSCPGDCGQCQTNPSPTPSPAPSGCTNGQTRNCLLAYKGRCAVGTETCVNGNWAGCPTPSQEICNKQDDNCDGQIDEGLTCECYLGENRPCGSNVGECKEGTRYCTSIGAWGECTGETKPSVEICNGKDDDCDASIDEECIAADNITTCQDGLIPETGCKCGDKVYITGYCYSGVYSEIPQEEFPWITITIFGVMIILIVTMVIIYKEFHKKGKTEVTWNELLKKYSQAL